MVCNVGQIPCSSTSIWYESVICTHSQTAHSACKVHKAMLVHIQALKPLEVLDLHSNLVETLHGITALINLRRLNLAGNRISQLCSLSMLTGLEDLNLSRNFVVSLTASASRAGQENEDSSNWRGPVLPASLQKINLAANRWAAQ